MAHWWYSLGTRVPFSDCQDRLTFRIEQFWGRAARASWIRKNPDACLSLGALAGLGVDSNPACRYTVQFCTFRPPNRGHSFRQL
jgi:hypothetical protein